jgi:adenylosuccinate synthase
LEDALHEGKTIIGEGAHGSLLDRDHGTSPFVTSSSTITGSWEANTGVWSAYFPNRILVVKIYDTRVGMGPFPTEIGDEPKATAQRRGDQMTEADQEAFKRGEPNAFAKWMRILTDEFGATSGRGRRIGWHDLVTLKYDCLLNNPTELAIMRLDMWGDIEFKLCEAYEYEGRRITQVPRYLGKVKPIYMDKTFVWPKEDLQKRIPDMIQDGWKAVPEYMRETIRIFCSRADKPASILGVGPDVGMIVEKGVFEATLPYVSAASRRQILAWKRMAHEVCDAARR